MDDGSHGNEKNTRDGHIRKKQRLGGTNFGLVAKVDDANKNNERFSGRVTDGVGARIVRFLL